MDIRPVNGGSSPERERKSQHKGNETSVMANGHKVRLSPSKPHSTSDAHSPESTGAPLFVPLQERNITRIKVKASWGDWVLKGMVPALKMGLSRLIDMENYSSSKKKLKHLEYLRAQAKQLPEKMQVLEKKIEDTQRQLHELVVQPSSSNQDLSKKYNNLSEKLEIMFLDLGYMKSRGIPNQKLLEEQENAVSVSGSVNKKSKKGLLSVFDAGFKLLADFRSTFKMTNQMSKASQRGENTVYELTLPEVSLGDPDSEIMHISNMRALIDRFEQTEDGQIHLSIREFQATMNSESKNGWQSLPVDIKGGVSCSIKPPLADKINDLLTCTPKQVLSRAKALDDFISAQRKTTSPERDHPITFLQKFVEIHLHGLQGTESSRAFIQNSSSQLLIQLLIPFLNKARKNAAKAVAERSNQTLSFWKRSYNFRQIETKQLKNEITRYKKDLDSLPDNKEHSVPLRTLITEKLARAEKDLKECAKQTTHIQSKIQQLEPQSELHNARARKDYSGGSATFNNSLQLFQALNRATTTPGQRVSIASQQFDIDDSHHVLLENIEADFGLISMTEGQSLSLEIPDLSARITLDNSETGKKTIRQVAFKNVCIRIDSPLSHLAQQAITMKFPLKFSQLATLFEQYSSMSQPVLDGTGQKVPFEMSRLIHISMTGGSVAEGSAKPSDASMSKTDTKALSESLTEIAGIKWNGDTLASRLQDSACLDDSSNTLLLNLLSRALVNADQSAESTEETDINTEAEPETDNSILESDATTDDIAGLTLSKKAEPDTSARGMKLSTLESQGSIDHLSVETNSSDSGIARFELSEMPDQLFGKLSGFSQWVLGGRPYKVVVTSTVTKGLVNIEKARLQLKLAKPGNLRQRLAKKIIQRRVKRQALTLWVSPENNWKFITQAKPAKIRSQKHPVHESASLPKRISNTTAAQKAEIKVKKSVPEKPERLFQELLKMKHLQDQINRERFVQLLTALSQPDFKKMIASAEDPEKIKSELKVLIKIANKHRVTKRAVRHLRPFLD